MKAEFWPMLMLVYTVSVSRSTSKCLNCLFHLFLSRLTPQSGLVWVLLFCFQTGSHYVPEASLEFCPASIFSQLLGFRACTTILGFISFCLRQGLVGFVLQSLPHSLEWHRTQQGLAFDSLYTCSFLFGIQAPDFNNQRLKYKSL